MTQEQQDKVLTLWETRKVDTLDIAKGLKMQEAKIYNFLATRPRRRKAA